MTYNEMAKLMPVNENYRDDRIETMQLQMDALKNFHKYEMNNLLFWNKFWKAFACVMMLCAVLLLVL